MNSVFRSRLTLPLLLCLGFTLPGLTQQITCKVQHAPNDAASQAYARQDFLKASQLYATQFKNNPADEDAAAGEVRSLLAAHQVDAAAKLAKSSFAAHPKSAILATALGEVRYRQGRLDDAFMAYRTAVVLDLCVPRTHYDLARLLRSESMYAFAYSQLQTAHALEPDDPDIQLAWIYTLPLAERASQIGSYLATAKGQSATRQQSMEQDESRLHAILASKNTKQSCRLASSSPTTTMLPFEYIERDEAGRYHSIGLNVKVNQKAWAQLKFDTGASGILLDRGTAKKAGLVPIATDTIAGIGDQKGMDGYWAYADDFRVGSLEFKDCMVEVSNKRSVVGVDGLIGADVFENYHIRLDFPLRQMDLSPLPARPGEAPNHGLNSTGVSSAASASATAPAKKSSAAATVQPVVRYRDRYVAPEMKSWSPFDRAGDHILIAGELKDRKPRLFLLDSGSDWSFLSTAAGKSVGKLHTDYDNQIEGLNGRVNKLYTVGYGNLIFAGLRRPFQHMEVMGLDSISNDSGMEVSGIIGIDTLIWLTLDIDYRDGLIHVSYDPKHGMNVYR